MAVVKGDPGQIRRNSLRGAFYLANHRGQLVMKAWPKKRPGPMSERQQAASDKFAEAALATKFMTGTAQEMARVLSKGTNGLPRDYLMMCLYGRLGWVVNINGRNLFAMASMQQVSLILDSIGQTSGDMLLRDAKYWRALSAGAISDVLTVLPDGSIGWAPAASSGGLPPKLGATHFDPLTGATFSANFWGGVSVMGLGSQTINAVEFWAKAASGAAQMIPTIYADGGNKPGALIQQGPAVVGATAGLNRLPLNAAVNFTAGTLYWVGMQVTLGAIQMAQTSAQPKSAYFSSSGSIPNPAPTAGTSSSGWGTMWAAV